MWWLLGTVLCVLGVFAAPNVNDEGQIWAVLVAGSNGYFNYRHQADICHAYQIFHRHGIPDSNIIVMMYDDIANNVENPKKGKIFNKPGGPNVYGPKKVPKDYIKDQVTPQNFINVLTGNSSGVGGVDSPKVLKSGPNDHVFVYFADHGGTGLIAFPDDYLYADDLIKALKTMYNKKMYQRLVFYMEACESGSMFNKILPKNINIFATTAATPYESSYACYWDEKLQTYLGDEYSVAWMEDVDSEEHQTNMTTETLKIQFNNVVKRVVESHPSMYGKKQFQKDHVTDYIGKSDSHTHNTAKRSLERFQDAVSVRDIHVRTLEKKIGLANSAEDKESLQKELNVLLKGRKEVDSLFKRILHHVTDNDVGDVKAVEQERQPLSLGMMPCYRTLVDSFHRECVNINQNTYVLGHLYKFANLCLADHISTVAVLDAFKSECGSNHQDLVGIH